MTGSNLLVPALTLLTLGTTLGVVRDPNQRIAFVVATFVIIAITFALAVRDRIRKQSPDWRLAAPALLGWAALAAVSFRNLETPVLLLALAALTYFLGRRERRLAAAAEATSSAALQIVAAFLGFLGAIGGTRMAPILLIAAAIWFLVWMPERARRVRDQDTLHVERDPDEVSAYLLDQRHVPLWYPGYLSSELQDGNELGVGATFRQVVEPRGRPMEAFVVVDEYEPGRRLCSRVTQAPGGGRSCYSFSPEAGGTVATYEFDVEQPYPSALIGSTFFVGDALRKVRAQRRQAFDKLKSILEA
jgi:polyketide cyclase/dehydrase/lipid transport protein